MKQWKVLAPTVVLLCLVPCASAALILEYKFNETGTSAASCGTDATGVTMRNSAGTATDLHGAAGSGLTGLASDRAFDNTASGGMGNPNTGGYANQTDNNAIDGLASITLTGWYKAGTTTFNGARLIDKDTTAFTLYGDAAPGRLVFYIDNSAKTSIAGYTDVDTWVFFAATYDGSNATNNVKFYKGTTNSSVVQVGPSQDFNSGAVNGSSAGLTVGNSPITNQRPFDGLLDNIRIYGAVSGASGALDLTALEALRLSDVAIPEPASLALAVLGGGLLLARRSRPQ